MVLPAIDLSQLLDVRLFTVEQLNNLTKSVVSMATMEVEKKIREKVSSKLKSTKETYETGIKTYINDFVGTIELVGSLPNMIENGASVFDMKSGFSKSAKKKTTNTGWYLTIPFRWGISTSNSTQFSNQMYQSIQKISQKLKASIVKEENSKIEYGGHITLEQLKKLNNYQAHKGQSAGWGNYQPYEHKSPIAQGILKIQKTYEKATQSTYVTFRRVSDKSEDNSWIHPGFKPANFFDSALKEIDIEKLMQPMIEIALLNNE